MAGLLGPSLGDALSMGLGSGLVQQSGLANQARQAALGQIQLAPIFTHHERIEFRKKHPETLREELQLETDEWLKDTI